MEQDRILGCNAVIEVSGEKGTIIGKAIFLGGKKSYLIRYCNNFGVAVEQWWDEDAIASIDKENRPGGSQDI